MPAIAGIEPGAALDVSNGMLVILDGNKGTLRLNAKAAEVEEVFAAPQERAEVRARRIFRRAKEAAVTLDGKHIEVVANTRGT